MSMQPVKRPYDRTSNVLIVDDDDTLLKFFKIHLNKFFSRVVVVENAKQALENIKDKEIDIVLTDVRMPKVDGLQLMEKIRKAHPDIPILLISGEPMNEEQQKQLEDADGFLAKPFSVDQLNSFIHQGADLRQFYKELTPCLKEPKKIREVLAASDTAFEKLIKKEEFSKAQTIIKEWRYKNSNQSAA